MNISEWKVLKYLYNEKNLQQRDIASTLGFSLGKVNQILKDFAIAKLIEYDYALTTKGKTMIEAQLPKRAIILAAGLGFRMIPLNKITNKALLNVHDTTLVERLITQLQEAGISEITIVVGYKKEEFEFLIDKYNVKLRVNKDYLTSNSLLSLNLVSKYLENCYIVPCDLYFHENPFLTCEPYSWYMLNTKEANQAEVKKLEAKDTVDGKWFFKHIDQTIGLAYVTKEDGKILQTLLQAGDQDSSLASAYWEECFYKYKGTLFHPIFMHTLNYVECNECEDLIKLDADSKSLNVEVFDIIMQVFNIQKSEIHNITCAKAGMTNNSFLFTVHNQKYIMRIPGEGTDLLINRKQEYDVYQKIGPLELSDKVFYFDAENGYKITAYINGAHNCDSLDPAEVKKAMLYLKNFHERKLVVDHEFDVFEKIDYYESLWNGKASIYADYAETKEHVLKLKDFIDSLDKEYTLTHVDAVPDNFIFHYENGQEYINLIDWEYASMQDPHLDIAMFAIYSLYDKTQIDNLIDMYFDGNCDTTTKLKIYSYIACSGLLWSNWCEYKLHLGVEFGEYSLCQYRYAKEFYQLVKAELGDKL